MTDLLLEILSEEIPARMQAGAARALEHQVRSRLEAARLPVERWEAFVTPRRLVLSARGLPAVQPDVTVERKGPRVDAPERALEGFLAQAGLTRNQCERRETPKGPVWFAVTREKGRATGALLAELLPGALAAVPWPKSMRWDSSGVRWVRPIRSILCLLDEAVVRFRFGTVESGRATRGHRLLSPDAFAVAEARGYADALARAKVMLDPAARARMIVEGAERLARAARLTLKPDDWLVSENAGLVEWPVVLMGRIDARFMALPDEVLTSAMRGHQRYFNLLEGDGRLAPRFVMVGNGETANGGASVVAGNERVLRARLADAAFFWDQDRRRRLEDRIPALAGIVFHARLGSMADKTGRIAAAARALCRFVDGADAACAARAGSLCKADLASGMVGEFPDLQGVVGRYYATADGEPPMVARAIAEHYAPQGPGDRCPTAPESVAVALADKLDTLAGFFAIDEKPTGSKDPFALRRAALGAIRLILENRLRLPLRAVLAEMLAGYGALLPLAPGAEAAASAVLDFLADRVKVHLRDRGVRHDLVGAVFAAGDEDDLVRLLARVAALERFLSGEDGANLLTAYRRAANILRIEEKKDGRSYAGPACDALFATAAERTLRGRLAEVDARAGAALREEAFEAAMVAMATLRAPVDAFFETVTVNCEDPARRRNRLMVLSEIRGSLDRVADFSRIEG